MRALLAIAARETSERVAILGAGVIAAAAVTASPQFGIADRELMAILLAAITGTAAAVMTGSSVVARDLAEGRLSFLFARPVTWWSIWGGKMLAAVVLTFATTVLAAAPGFVLGAVAWPDLPFAATILLPATLTVVGAAHAGAVAYRSRSLRLVFDLVLLAMATGATAAIVQPLTHEVLFGATRVLVGLGLWTTALALSAAGAAQVALGRTDIRRGHRVLSLVLWSAAGVSLSVFAGLAWWLLHPSLSDLAPPYFGSRVPHTDWVEIAGRARHRGWYTPAFLWQPATGSAVRLDSSFLFLGPVFSEDGRRAVWAERAPRSGQVPRLRVADFDGPPPPRVQPASPPLAAGAVRELALSPDGDRVAVVQADRLSVVSLGSRQPVTAIGLAEGTIVEGIAFMGNETLRAVRHRPSDGALEVLEMDLAAHRTRTMVAIPTRGGERTSWSSSRQRLLVVERPDPHASAAARLYDAGTGALLARLAGDGRSWFLDATFLPDDRIALLRKDPETTLSILSKDGVEAARVALGPDGRGFALAPIDEGLLAIGGLDDEEVLFVDVTAARVIRREPGLRLLWSPTPFGGGRFSAMSANGRGIFVQGRSLVDLDPRTGARRVLLDGH